MITFAMFINVLHDSSTNKMPLLSCNASLRSYVDEPRLSRAVHFNMRLINLVGQRFHKLVVIERSENDADGKPKWLCKCDCGNIKSIRGIHLKSGRSKSCGCAKIERLITHGKSDLPEYQVWQMMIQRCTNQKYNGYHNYGGRGIAVCNRWLGEHGFENFIVDMGLRPSQNHSIDRYPNNDGNYEPSNCRWATRKQQSRSRRVNVNITYNGETHIQAEWEEIMGFKEGIVSKRRHMGWSVDRILNTKIRQHAAK